MAGRVPPSLLATALLLQTYDKVSDAEAKARADFDIRWKVALGIEIEDRPFAKSTLLRAQLILHDKVREVLQPAPGAALPEKAWERATYILGRGAVKGQTGSSTCPRGEHLGGGRRSVLRVQHQGRGDD